MVYVYKKKDIKKENPIHLSEGVRFKSLWNKALKFEQALNNEFCVMNLKFDSESEETRREIYKAIDHLRTFKHNLKLKTTIKEEYECRGQK